MSYTISDNTANIFPTAETGLTVKAYLAQDFAVIPSKYQAPPAGVTAQATATADNTGAFTLTVPFNEPCYLVAQSLLNSNTYYWAIGKNPDLGLAASGITGTGAAATGVTALGILGQYSTTLPTPTSGKYIPLQTDSYGRIAEGQHSVNLITVPSAANTGIGSGITYDNSGAFFDVSMFTDVTVKLNITAAAGGTAPTVIAYVDLIDAQGNPYTVFTSDTMTTTAGALTLARYISVGKAAATGNTGVVQGVNTSLAGSKLRVRLVGGGTAANTSLTYSLVVDAR